MKPMADVKIRTGVLYSTLADDRVIPFSRQGVEAKGEMEAVVHAGVHASRKKEWLLVR